MKELTPSDIEITTLGPDGFILKVQPARTTAGLAAWAAEHRQWLGNALLEHGAILLRGFPLDEPVTDFARVAETVMGPLADYVYGSTPRTALGKQIYTATEYPARATIAQHNEIAYGQTWPLKLMFLCSQVAETGGATPLALTARVTRAIRPEIREKFGRLGVMYVRNYRDMVDLPWQTVFQTEHAAEVEAYCRENAISFEWKADGTLRTTQVCQGMAVHPITQAELWFNQAHLFHASSLDKASRQVLRALYAQEDFPRHAYYGDGSAIEDAVLDEIRAAYASATFAFPWARHDVLLVDNMLASHGREPFTGHRTVLVAMGEPYSCQFQVSNHES